MYDNERDAQRYLDNSIIRLKKTPVMVLQCYERGEDVILDVQHLRSGKREAINIKDESLDFSPVPLGYGMLDNGKVFFVSRQPRRRTRRRSAIGRQRRVSGPFPAPASLSGSMPCNRLRAYFRYR